MYRRVRLVGLTEEAGANLLIAKRGVKMLVDSPAKTAICDIVEKVDVGAFGTPE